MDISAQADTCAMTNPTCFALQFISKIKSNYYRFLIMITIYVEEPSGERTPIEAPTDMNLSLMELLKAAEYNIMATCGGMAICATCHVEVLEGEDFFEPSDAELDMLDTLPEITDTSRLACQMRLSADMDGLVVRIAADMEEF
ncbi:MAG: 2Fe-2S ferredoxin [Arenicella sp.]|jgi:2Fe-2S ferredoxin